MLKYVKSLLLLLPVLLQKVVVMNKVEIVIIHRFQVQLRASPIDSRPAPSKNEHSDRSSEQVEVQTQKMNLVACLNNFVLKDLIYFIAFLAKVTSHTIMQLKLQLLLSSYTG